MTIKVYFKPGSDASVLDPYRRRKPLVLDETNDTETTEMGYFCYIDKNNKNHCINKDVIDEIIIEETQQ